MCWKSKTTDSNPQSFLRDSTRREKFAFVTAIVKILTSRLFRTGFTGYIVVFRNTAEAIFSVGQAGLTLAQFLTKVLLTIEIRKCSHGVNYRANFAANLATTAFADQDAEEPLPNADRKFDGPLRSPLQKILHPQTLLPATQNQLQSSRVLQ